MEEACRSVGMNARCEKTIKEPTPGDSSTGRVGRKTGTDEVRRERVRGEGAAGPKSRKTFRPMREESSTVSQWPVPNLGRGHQEHLADGSGSDACTGGTYGRGSEAQKTIEEVDFSSWESTIYKKNFESTVIPTNAFVEACHNTKVNY